MKKTLCIVALIVMLLTMLTACGKFECDLCGKEKSGGKNKKEVLGEEIVYCDECADGLNSLANMFG